VWIRAQKKYEETRTLRKEAIIREVAGDGVMKAKDALIALQVKVQAAEEELSRMGFAIDDDDDALHVVSYGSRLYKTIEKRLDQEVGTKEDVLTQAFASARVKLSLVATAEEAQQIVEPLLNFEVKVK